MLMRLLLILLIQFFGILSIMDFKKQEFTDALNSNNLPLVKELVTKFGINAKDDSDRTLLHLAAAVGNIEIIKYLILQGADIKAKDILSRTPYDFAIINKHPEIAKYLNGGTPLHWAVSEGKLEEVKKLVDQNKNKKLIDIVNNNGETALHIAAKQGNIEMAKYLVLHGADTTAKDRFGSTPYQDAKDARQYLVAQYLKDAESNIEPEYLQALFNLNNDLIALTMSLA
ncbi:MAG: ankyrin repeat domain-containing protein [Candidatus Babeliaceae bacterium]